MRIAAFSNLAISRLFPRHRRSRYTSTSSEYSTPGDTHDLDDWTQSTVDSHFHAIVTDLAGNPTELVNPHTGTIAAHSVTTLWGHTRWSGSASTPLRFAGQQHDPETGLHYNRYRYYNPSTAAYTSPDPLGIGPNPASSTAYVHNPLTVTDPLGLHPVGKLIALELRPVEFTRQVWNMAHRDSECEPSSRIFVGLASEWDVDPENLGNYEKEIILHANKIATLK